MVATRDLTLHAAFVSGFRISALFGTFIVSIPFLVFLGFSLQIHQPNPIYSKYLYIVYCLVYIPFTWLG
jgi:hypothetical protein